jgi:uncharacterized protein (DUF1697 family)
MADLRELFASLGCKNVGTYIQSGNVIYDCSGAVASKIDSLVSAGIRERHGYAVPVVTRRGKELVAAVQRNPFVGSADPAHLSVAFLAKRPTAADVAKLEADRSPPDRFAVLGSEIHLYMPDGVAGSKLTNQYFDSRLKTVSTARNWRTVHKLIELTGAGTA